jgi:hypothetical protein
MCCLRRSQGTPIDDDVTNLCAVINEMGARSAEVCVRVRVRVRVRVSVRVRVLCVCVCVCVCVCACVCACACACACAAMQVVWQRGPLLTTLLCVPLGPSHSHCPPAGTTPTTSNHHGRALARQRLTPAVRAVRQ